MAGTCTLDGCALPHLARGRCTKHYKEWQRKTGRIKRRYQGTCAAPGCPKPHEARGWCQPHYQLWRRHGDALHPPKAVRTTCTIEGCPDPHKSRGWCEHHYGRWRRLGDPLGVSARPGGFGRLKLPYLRHRKALLAAAANVCQLCGELVDLRPGAPWGMRPSIDHIVPGSDHRIENLRIAHISCNSSRRDRADVHAVPPPWERNPELQPVAGH